jgi:hypothetical protein
MGLVGPTRVIWSLEIGAARCLAGVNTSAAHRTNWALPGKRVAGRSRSARKGLISNDTNPPSPPAEFPRPARNKGKLTDPKPPLRPGHVWSIRAKLQMERGTRDLALFNLAIDSKLRGCDLVALRDVDDVAPNGYAVDRATVRQSKTGRPVRFELTDVTRHWLDYYLRPPLAAPANACSLAAAAQIGI